MNLNMFITLAGGLGLFIYGMKMMGDGLERAAGNRLKRLLEILTENRLMGLLVGAVVTAVIQSSSATTVMVVGFVNAGIMTLNQAVGVIMGANIGTTMTAFLISLNLTSIAPIAVFIGVGLIFFSKRKAVKSFGEILVGFGILFMGMDFMTQSMVPLRDNEGFHRIITSVSNPVLGVLAGTIMTVVLQSSSAAVGILQALAAQGLIGLDGAIFILFGQNIGTCVTAILASMGTNTNAKRAAFIHFAIKTIGTSIFMVAMLFGIPFVDLIFKITPDSPMSQIANAHIAFNVITAIILYPFGKALVGLSKNLIHGKKEEVDERGLMFLDERILETPPIAVGQVMKEVGRMADFALNNVKLGMEAFFQRDKTLIDKVLEIEEIINFLNEEITHYLVLCNGLGLSKNDFLLINSLFHVVNDIERVGDHAENIVEYAEYSIENDLSYSEMARNELREMSGEVMEMLVNATTALKDGNIDLAKKVLAEEEGINRLKDKFRQSHIGRLNSQKCSASSGVIYLDMVTNLERIADHATNIAQSVTDKEKHVIY